MLTPERRRVAKLARLRAEGQCSQAELDEAIEAFKNSPIERRVADMLKDQPKPSDRQIARVLDLLYAGSRLSPELMPKA